MQRQTAKLKTAVAGPFLQKAGAIANNDGGSASKNCLGMGSQAIFGNATSIRLSVEPKRDRSSLRINRDEEATLRMTSKGEKVDAGVNLIKYRKLSW